MSDSDEKIREEFRKKHASDWNPIVVEFPWFGKDEKPREVIKGIVEIFAACGYEVGNMLVLKLDEDLVKEAMALAGQVDEFRKHARKIFQEKLGDPHNILLDDLFREKKGDS